jgi:hypothetical protein
MIPRSKFRPQGQLRNSQVITTFGPGALLDLPNHAIIVGGLEEWVGVSEEIPERRLVEKLKEYLQKKAIHAPQLRLCAPPADNEDPSGQATWITAWQFPEWFSSQDVVTATGGLTRSRLLVHRKRLLREVILKTTTARNIPWSRSDSSAPATEGTSETSTGIGKFIRKQRTVAVNSGLMRGERAGIYPKSRSAANAVNAATWQLPRRPWVPLDRATALGPGSAWIASRRGVAACPTSF